MKTKIKYSLLALLMVVSTVISTVTMTNPALAAPADNASLDDQAKAFTYYRAFTGVGATFQQVTDVLSYAAGRPALRILSTAPRLYMADVTALEEEPPKHPGGRPLKFETVEEIDAAIEAYLGNCELHKSKRAILMDKADGSTL